MFENFIWKDLDNIPRSDYMYFCYDIRCDESTLILRPALMASAFAERGLVFGRWKGGKEKYIIKSQTGKTCLLLSSEKLEGNALPDETEIIIAIIKENSNVMSAELSHSRKLYRISEIDYRELLIKQVKGITDEILSSDIDLSAVSVNELAKVFSAEKALPREDVVFLDGHPDKFTAVWVRNLLNFAQEIGTLSNEEKTIREVNEQTHKYAVEKGKELTRIMNETDNKQ